MQENLQTCINQELKNQNIVAFPEKDTNTMVVLNRED